jgi:protein-S-isoprenylcysteine O-methyltransferase Ste14
MASAFAIAQGIWIGLGGLWMIRAFPRQRTAAIERRSPVLHYILIGTAFMLMFTSRLRLGPLGERWVADAPATATIGLALTTVGALLAAWARVGLAANWSSSVAIQRDHMLIRGGPYAFLRHPIYAGLLVALLGTALVLGEVRGLAAVALAVIAWGWKSRQEDAILLRRFGPEYERYRREVRAFVPFLW